MPLTGLSDSHIKSADSGVDAKCATFVVVNARASQRPNFRPLLIVRTDSGESHVPREPAAWVRHILEYQSGNAHTSLRIIGRLYQYTSGVFGDIPLTADDLPMVIWNYVAFRVGERNPDDLDAQLFPHWLPVRKRTAEVEFRTIVDYLRFCHDKYETLPILSLPARLTKFPAFDKTERRDFLIHLRGHRERLRKLMGHEFRPKPHLIETASVIPKRSSAGQTMPRDEIDLIINAEQNPAFKWLWLLLAYGGIRVSEALNLWCCDIMSGEMIGEFEPGFTQTEPLVVLADPINSRFTGTFHDTSRRRIEALLADFGLPPRPNYPNKHPLRAGWKSMLMTNMQMNVSWVYWAQPEPARAFLDLTAQILNIRRDISAAQNHPYLLINTSNSARLGEPQKYSNIAKAFDRACERVGLEPHVAGRHIHGLRHFYKYVLKHLLKLDAETIQVMMHHKSVESQDDYARSAAVHFALEQARLRVANA